MSMEPDKTEKIGVIVVDHGSRYELSNQTLEQVAQMFKQSTGHQIVAPAHMEIAEPTISAAFDNCVAQGANHVIVLPYFLLPGKHSSSDIPAMSVEAAKKHPGVKFTVAEPLGLHDLIIKVMDKRVNQALAM